MDKEIRVRFAPSPTGFLHVGGVRTALYNYLFARNTNGRFLLRIEDTDISRSEERLSSQIIESLEWLGLEWDEEIVYQSKRVDTHTSEVDRLLESGAAYRCFCDPSEHDRLRAEAKKKGRVWKYGGDCSALTPEDVGNRLSGGDKFVVRFKVGREGPVEFDDLVYGRVRFARSEIEDFALLRRNGAPTYHLAVVVDDEFMEISHIIRGEDHISNTPKQIMLGEALGYGAKTYAHLPLIAGADGKRLSKRHGATSVGEFRDEGFLPETLVNFLALLGWSPGDDREKMSRKELVEAFDISRVNKRMAVLDTKKLEWLNGKYLAEKPAAELLSLLVGKLESLGVSAVAGPGRSEEWMLEVVTLLQSRARRIGDIVDNGIYFFEDPSEYAEKFEKKHFRKKPGIATEILTVYLERINGLPEFTVESLEQALREMAEEEEIGAGKIIHPVRLACTGTGMGPGLFEILVLLGRETVIRRMNAARDHVGKLAAAAETDTEA